MQWFIVNLEMFDAGGDLESSHLDAIQETSKEAACAAIVDQYSVDAYDHYEVSAVALDLSMPHQQLFVDGDPHWTKV